MFQIGLWEGSRLQGSGSVVFLGGSVQKCRSWAIGMPFKPGKDPIERFDKTKKELGVQVKRPSCG